MRIAVIDIGSNTIKMTVYDYGREKLLQIMNTTKHIGLISYIEGGILSDKGIRVLADTVSDLALEAGRHSCFYVFPFATASLRRASNFEQVISAVKEQTGYTIDLISGDEEAKFSFQGIITEMGDTLDENGIAFDMGGGSTEIIRFENKKPTAFISLDIGVLALYNDFVNRLLPTEKECAKITKYTDRLFNKVPFIGSEPHSVHIYMIGGTGKAIARLHCALSGRPFVLPCTLDISELHELLHKLICEGEHKTKVSALSEIPSRVHTVCPGLCAVLSLMRACSAQKLTVTGAAVREGYALHIASLNGIAND